ncbi:hypothetical protein R1flu_023690 [Riccia fluitans]|uniref:Uncharacterized protein n=1 Tax=Riccia fluitans TaxID=41844 RepID=A0ABD1XWU2_9MARC
MLKFLAYPVMFFLAILKLKRNDFTVIAPSTTTILSRNVRSVRPGADPDYISIRCQDLPAIASVSSGCASYLSLDFRSSPPNLPSFSAESLAVIRIVQDLKRQSEDPQLHIL